MCSIKFIKNKNNIMLVRVILFKCCSLLFACCSAKETPLKIKFYYQVEITLPL